MPVAVSDIKAPECNRFCWLWCVAVCDCKSVYSPGLLQFASKRAPHDLSFIVPLEPPSLYNDSKHSGYRAQ